MEVGVASHPADLRPLKLEQADYFRVLAVASHPADLRPLKQAASVSIYFLWLLHLTRPI